MNYSNSVAMKVDVVEPSWLRHKRMGHLTFQSLKILQQHDMVIGLPSIQEAKEACEGCAKGNQHRDSFPSEGAWRASKPLELIHSDVCGPMKTATHGERKKGLPYVLHEKGLPYVFWGEAAYTTCVFIESLSY
ncbi:hypothetical protein ACE6H2_002833 [Prunus campanulata]